MIDPKKLRVGMLVRRANGEKLGKIHSLDLTTFEVGEGLFFKEDFPLDYDDILEIKKGEVVLRKGTIARLAPATPEGAELLAKAERHLHHTPQVIEPVSVNSVDPEPGVVHVPRK